MILEKNECMAMLNNFCINPHLPPPIIPVTQFVTWSSCNCYQKLQPSRSRRSIHYVSHSTILFCYLTTSNSLYIIAKAWRIKVASHNKDVQHLCTTLLCLSYMFVNAMLMTCRVLDLWHLCTAAAYSSMLVMVVLVAVRTQVSTRSLLCMCLRTVVITG